MRTDYQPLRQRTEKKTALYIHRRAITGSGHSWGKQEASADNQDNETGVEVKLNTRQLRQVTAKIKQGVRNADTLINLGED